jgi:hypothetical protein
MLAHRISGISQSLVNEAMKEHPFGLNDGDFWNDPEERLMDFRFDRMAKGRDEILIDGPGRIAMDVRRTVPVYAYYGGYLRTIMANKFSCCALATAVCPETGAVLVSRAVLEKGGPKAQPKDEDPGDAITSELYRLELNELLNLPWAEGNWLVTVAMRQFVSNRIQLRLEKSAIAFRDPEVDKFLARQRRTPRPEPIWPPPAVWPAVPAQELPYYRRMPESPEVPAQPGISLVIQRVISLKPGARAVLRGSFRLPVLERDIIPPAAGPQYQYEFGYLRPTAIVPVSLVIAGSDSLGPIHLKLRVPSYSEVEASSKDQAANGFFTIDLLQLEDFVPLAQTYFVYALSGESFTGPVLFALVRE